MNKYLRLVISSFAAGVIMSLASFELIAMGSADQYIAGAWLQGFGLLLVIYFGLSLYNPKLTGVFNAEHKLSYIIDLIIMLVINIATLIGIAYLIRLASNNGDALVNTAEAFSLKRVVTINDEVGKEWYMTILSAMACGVICFIGGLVYKKSNHPFIKALSIFFAVGLYVVCGFENIMTNTFYIAFAQHWTAGIALDLVLVIVGNSIGAIISYFATLFINKSSSN